MKNFRFLITLLLLSAALCVGNPLLAQDGVIDDDNNITRNDDIDDDGGDNWGWIGLLGLIGLAGLRKRRDNDYVATTRTTTNNPNR